MNKPNQTDFVHSPNTHKGVKRWLILGCGFLILASATAGVLFSARTTLNGKPSEKIVLGEPYREMGCTAKLLWFDFSSIVHVAGTADESTPGTYTLTYQGFPWQKPLTRTVEVQDITIPVLTLAQGEHLYIELNEPFQEPGYQAIDNYDGDITELVQISGEVDITISGEYTLSYVVSDSSGNETRAQRIITVLSRSPLTMSIKEFSLNEFFSDVILPLGEDAGEDYLKETIFIGDSITENALAFHAFPYKSVWAKPALEPQNIMDTPLTIYGGGEDGKDVEMPALDAAEKFQPKRLIINIGSNCIYKTSPDEFVEYYDAFLKEFLQRSPHTQIIVSSVYPVDQRYDKSEKSAYTTNNDKINKINYALASLCREEGYHFLNVSDALKDSSGQAVPDSTYPEDGIHPKASVYPIIVEYIRTHPYQ